MISDKVPMLPYFYLVCQLLVAVEMFQGQILIQCLMTFSRSFATTSWSASVVAGTRSSTTWTSTTPVDAKQVSSALVGDPYYSTNDLPMELCSFTGVEVSYRHPLQVSLFELKE